MQMASTSVSGARDTSGWAIGFGTFAALMLVMIGAFQAFEGLAAIIKDQAYVVGPNYAYKIDTTAWGWINLIWGIVVAIAGFGIFAGQTWARIVGITVVVLSAIGEFFYIPYYPVWAILIIALDVVCIWALTTWNAGNEVSY
jgi:hypothetical protein